MRVDKSGTRRLGIESWARDFDRVFASGRRIRDRVLKDNNGLVRKSSVWWIKRLSGAGICLELEDLDQWGRLGVLRAMEDYDPELSSFCTWAKQWIFAYQRRPIDASHFIRPAVWALRNGFRPVKVSSLDAVIPGLDRAECRIDSVISTTLPDPETATIENQLISDMISTLGTLDARSRDVVQRNYGIGTGVEETYVEIAATYGLSCERVRQIRNRALGLLRNRMNARRRDAEGCSTML